MRSVGPVRTGPRRRGRSARVCATFVLCVVACTALACTRARYRYRADRETYPIVESAAQGTPWSLPPAYTIQPNPQSRFFERTRLDSPALPAAAPRLYTYEIPVTRSQMHAEERNRSDVPSNDESSPEPIPPGMPAGPTTRLDGDGAIRLPPVDDTGTRMPTQLEDGESLASVPRRFTPIGEAHALAESETSSAAAARSRTAANDIDRSPDDVRPAQFVDEGASQIEDDPVVQPGAIEPLPAPGETFPQYEDALIEEEEAVGLPVVSIPPSAWEAIPPECLARMFEFARVRAEWERTYDLAPSLRSTEGATPLTLQQIVEVALIDSREYQSQKEALYRAALALTLERFDYQLKYLVAGNGTDVDYLHRRRGGITTNTLGIVSGLSADKMLTTGGTLLARFANDILLTFNGPQGFTADVSSELLLSLTQTVFQRGRVA